MELMKIKNIVIIDDSPYKRQDIKNYMEKIYPYAEIKEYGCINNGLYELCVKMPRENIVQEETLAVVDMCMPSLVGGMPEKDGGMQLLMELERKGMKYPAIIASSEEVNVEEAKDIYSCLLGAVKESPFFYNEDRYRELLMV